MELFQSQFTVAVGIEGVHAWLQEFIYLVAGKFAIPIRVLLFTSLARILHAPPSAATPAPPPSATPPTPAIPAHPKAARLCHIFPD